MKAIGLAVMVVGVCLCVTTASGKIKTASNSISADAVQEMVELAKYDLLIVTPGDLINYHPEWFVEIRQMNPDIIILGHISSMEIPLGYAGVGQAWHSLLVGVKDQWWLRNPEGQKIEFWPGSPMLNLSSQCPKVEGLSWPQYLAAYSNAILDLGLLDGVMYDNIFADISSVHTQDNPEPGYFDTNNDGQVDDPFRLITWWKEGQQELVGLVRKAHPEAMIVVNGDMPSKDISGRHLENFPQYGSRAWLEQIRLLQTAKRHRPVTNIINRAGQENDGQRCRFGLCSSLMADDVYFSFDQGAVWHGDIWWYSEYELTLGKPQGDFQVKRFETSVITEAGGFEVSNADPGKRWTPVWLGNVLLGPDQSYYVTVDYSVTEKPDRLAFQLSADWDWLVNSFVCDGHSCQSIQLDFVTDVSLQWQPKIVMQGQGEVVIERVRIERHQHIVSRRFENGLVLVSDFDTPQTVKLDGDYVTLEGQLVNKITLAGHDGCILLEPGVQLKRN